MRVESLALTGFRNYDSQEAIFGPDINLVLGRNAQGKTNLLEAVYLLTGSRGFRSFYDRDLIGFGRDWAELRARVDSGGRRQEIRLLLRRGRRRTVTVNEVKKTSAELSETVKAVLFSPDDLYLIKAGAAARRRLMDGAISQLRSGYAALLTDYNRLYENKTRILRDWREKPALLKPLDEFSDGLARCSARLIRYRASFAARLGERAARIHREFSGGEEELEIVYKTVSTVEDPLAPAQELYRAICEHQAAHRQAELDARQCLTGAHRDDLEISINGAPARAFASQGQARTAALSVKLAEREIFYDETGQYPVLLLDDVLSELDAARQEFVLHRIGGGQTVITCCEAESVGRRLGGRVLRVEGGRITEGL